MRGLGMLGFVCITLAGTIACEPDDPCQDYVDYMCSCHEDVDCKELERTFDDPSGQVQDDCAVTLDEQKQDDKEDGLECEAG